VFAIICGHCVTFPADTWDGTPEHFAALLAQPACCDGYHAITDDGWMIEDHSPDCPLILAERRSP
jgi:hypothetical protein